MSITTVSVVSAAIAESLVSPLIGQRIQVRLHTGDPGVGGLSDEAAEVSPAVVQVADWGGFGDHTPTQDYGGRFVETEEVADFGTASGTETVSWCSLWHEDDPDGAPGTYDVWLMNIELKAPRTYSENDTVRFPVSNLKLFGSGNYLMDEGS